MDALSQELETIIKELLTNNEKPLAEVFRIIDFPPYFKFGPHKHQRIEINIVTKGYCTMQFESEIVGFNKNDCMIVFPDTEHYFEVSAKKVTLAQLEFNLDIFTDLQVAPLEKSMVLLHRILTNSQSYIKIFNNLEIKSLVQHIVSEIQQQREGFEIMTRLLYAQLFMVISRHIREKISFPITRAHPVLIKSLEYIQSHFTENIDLSQLAAQSNISDRYLRKLFQENLKISPVDYLLSLRIDLAKTILKSNDSGLKEIAYLCGFSSPQYFSLKFKQHTGITPMVYKKLLFRNL